MRGTKVPNRSKQPFRSFDHVEEEPLIDHGSSSILVPVSQVVALRQRSPDGGGVPRVWASA